MASLDAHETDPFCLALLSELSLNDITGLSLCPLSPSPGKLIVSGLSLVTALCPLKAEPTGGVCVGGRVFFQAASQSQQPQSGAAASGSTALPRMVLPFKHRSPSLL